jgi:hypothetical protein
MLAGRQIMRLDAPVNSRFFSQVSTGLVYMVALQRLEMITTQITLEQKASYIESLGDVDLIFVVYP